MTLLRRGHRRRLLLLIGIIVMLTTNLVGCGGDSGTPPRPEGTPIPTGEGSRVPSAMLQAETSGKVQSERMAHVDYGNADRGYIMVRVETDGTKHVRVQITNLDDNSRIYSPYYIKPSQHFTAFPLTLGSGNYEVSIQEHVEPIEQTQTGTTSQTVVLTRVRFEVTLENDFAPFLVNTQYIEFSQNSSYVQLAKELCKSANNDLDVIYAFYTYIGTNIKYDYDIADKVKNNEIERPYIPDLEQVMQRKSGICFDYASLLAAMLRSQGIPTQLCIGYAAGSSGKFRHAWNRVYTRERGWVDVVYFVGDDWVLMDPTFYAGGDSDYVGLGEQYETQSID